MIGQFVTSKAGHDQNTLYVIVAEEEAAVLVCDGRLKPIERPKRKLRKHVQPINKTVDGELVKALQEQRAANEQIKRAIKLYRQELQGSKDL